MVLPKIDQGQTVAEVFDGVHALRPEQRRHLGTGAVVATIWVADADDEDGCASALTHGRR